MIANAPKTPGMATQQRDEQAFQEQRAGERAGLGDIADVLGGASQVSSIPSGSPIGLPPISDSTLPGPFEQPTTTSPNTSLEVPGAGTTPGHTWTLSLDIEVPPGGTKISCAATDGIRQDSHDHEPRPIPSRSHRQRRRPLKMPRHVRSHPVDRRRLVLLCSGWLGVEFDNSSAPA